MNNINELLENMEGILYPKSFSEYLENNKIQDIDDLKYTLQMINNTVIENECDCLLSKMEMIIALNIKLYRKIWRCRNEYK
ncbi:MAG: hypothetical protein ACRCW9_03950 [Cetobacterium sp.]